MVHFQQNINNLRHLLSHSCDLRISGKSCVFYVCEVNINPLVKNFSDALWWATMEAVTVGSNIQAVTLSEKFSVFEAVFGMLMIPMFTVYVTNIVGTFQKSQPTSPVRLMSNSLSPPHLNLYQTKKTDDKHKDDKADKKIRQTQSRQKIKKTMANKRQKN